MIRRPDPMFERQVTESRKNLLNGGWPPLDRPCDEDDVLKALALFQHKNGRSPSIDAHAAAAWRLWAEYAAPDTPESA